MNYMVASYSHSLQVKIGQQRKAHASLLRTGQLRKYVGSMIQAPMMYLLIIAVDVYMLTVTSWLYRQMIVGQLSWTLAEAFVHSRGL